MLTPLGLLSARQRRDRAVRRRARQLREHLVSRGAGGQCTPSSTGVSGQDARGRVALRATRRCARRRPLPGRHAASRGQAVAYVVAFVRSERDRAAVLRLGSAGPIKVWVNGAAVLHARRGPPAVAGSGRGRHPPRPGLEPDPDQDRHQRRGLAVVRACHGRRGRSLGLREIGPPPLPATRRRPASSATGAARRHARRVLGTIAPPSGGGGRAVDLARVLAWTTPRDRDDRAASVALTQAFDVRPTGSARRAAGAALRLAAAEATDDDDERRRMLEQALDARPPPHWRARCCWRALGANGARGAPRGARRWRRGARRWRSNPECWPAALAIAQEEADAGLPLTGVTRLEALPAKSGAAARAARGGAPVRRGGAAARGRSRARPISRGSAAGHRPDAPAVDPGAPPRRRRRRRATRLAAWWRCGPDVPSLEIELARLLEGAGDAATRARDVLRRWPRGCPKSRRSLVALGKLLHRRGRATRPSTPLRTALALRPAGSRAEAVPRSPERRGARGRRASPTSSRAASPRTRCGCCRRPRGRRRSDRRAARWCCWIGAWCACTGTACRAPSPSASSRC